MNKTETFIELYKQLEQLAMERYGYPPDGRVVYQLERRPEFRSLRENLDYCREVRNLLQHRKRLGDSFPVEPSGAMIELLRTVIDRVADPPRARDIQVPLSKVLQRTAEDLVRPTMLEMQARGFSHVPILQDGVVVGVFSENTVFSCLVNGEVVGIDEGMRFSDLSAWLPPEKHRSESFRFIREDKLVEEIGAMIEKAQARHDRIGLIFTTKTGSPREPIRGLLTAWDVAGVRQGGSRASRQEGSRVL